MTVRSAQAGEAGRDLAIGEEELLGDAPEARLLPRLWVLFEERILLNVAALFMVGAMAVMVYEAVNRSLFSTSYWWAEELVRFSVLWGVLLGLGPAARHHHFIRMDLLVLSLPRRGKLALAALSALAGLGFALALAWTGVQEVQHMQRMRMMTDSNLDLPLWLVRLVLPIGGALYALHFLGALYAALRGHDPNETLIR